MWTIESPDPPFAPVCSLWSPRLHGPTLWEWLTSTYRHSGQYQLSSQNQAAYTVSVPLTPLSHVLEKSKLISSHSVTTSEKKEGKFPCFAFQQLCNLSPLYFWHSVSDFHARLRVGNKNFFESPVHSRENQPAGSGEENGIQGLGRMYQAGYWVEKGKEQQEEHVQVPQVRSSLMGTCDELLELSLFPHLKT